MESEEGQETRKSPPLYPIVVGILFGLGHLPIFINYFYPFIFEFCFFMGVGVYSLFIMTSIYSISQDKSDTLGLTLKYAGLLLIIASSVSLIMIIPKT